MDRFDCGYHIVSYKCNYSAKAEKSLLLNYMHMKKFLAASIIGSLLASSAATFASTSMPSTMMMDNGMSMTPTMMQKDMITMVGGANMYSSKDIVSNVVNAPNLTTLVAAVKAAGLVETLQGTGPFTVFGPDNNAFAKIDSATLNNLLKPENKDMLTKILTYHVVAGKYTIGKLRNGQTLTTVQGGKLTVRKKNYRVNWKFGSIVLLTDENGNSSRIITPNVYQKNGVAHVINSVLMPSNETVTMVGGANMYSSKDIVSNVVNAPNLTTLVAAVKAAGLVETLQGTGPFTVFGPDNNAFAKIDSNTLNNLLKPENKDMLVKILTYHVVAGKYSIGDLRDGQTLMTVQGGKLVVQKTGNTVMLRDENGNTATIVTPDVFQKNGVAHVIDSVVMPK